MFGRRTLRTAAVLAGAAIALSSFAGAQASVRSRDAGSASSNGRSIGPSNIWDYYNDYVATNPGSNPSPGGVWSYRVGTLGAPQSSTPLPLFTQGQGSNPTVSSWYNPAGPLQQPRVSVNHGPSAVTVQGDCGTITIPPAKGFVHPYDASRAAVIGWTSPITGRVKMRVALKLAESPNCGNGIKWAVWQNGAQLPGAAGNLTGSGVQSHSIGAQVTAGDTIYLVIDSRNSNITSDDTLVTFAVVG